MKSVLKNDEKQSDHELFVSLLTRHERSIRAYIRAGVFSSSDVGEVMQDVSLVAWRKFSDLDDPEEGFLKWACVIARYEILKFRRSKARDRLVLDESILEKVAEEGIEEVERNSPRISALEYCLGALSESRRDLILEAYSEGASITDIASDLGKDRNGLYQMLWRIRQELAKCIERKEAVLAKQ